VSEPLVIETAYTYAAQIERVIDGDTLLVMIDCGFELFHRQRLRLLAVNAPEMSTEAGRETKKWVQDWLIQHSPEGSVLVHTRKAKKTDKYGRYLASVDASDGTNLNNDLLATGHAVEMWV
jgi:micrococcal nuclease